VRDLPKGWYQTVLEYCVEIHDSTRVPINNSERNERIKDKDASELFPYFGATGQVGLIDDFLFDGEYVALGEDGVPFFNPLKHKAYLLKGKTWVNNHAHVIKGISAIDNRYLCYFLNQFDYHGFVNGATRLKLTQASMRKIPVKLAPLNEQIRIADKLDSILAKVDQAQARFDKIPHILKRFRQSVLVAATSGELTREWRGKDESFETEIPGFFIPIEWQYSNIESIGAVKGGKRLPKGDELTEVDTGLPYIRAGQLKNGTVIQGDNARNKQMFLQPETQAQIKRYTVNEGDAYLTIVGASIGDAGIIPKALHLANLTENAAKITDLSSLINASFLSIWLRSEKLQQLIQLEIKSGAQGKLALKRINTLPVPLPPLDEQNEIVRRVEELFSYAGKVERGYQEVKSRVDRLTQSILAKAFRGELVEQNPNDEPAEKLLARIVSDLGKKSSMKPKGKSVSKITNMKIQTGNAVNEASVKKWIENLKVSYFSNEDLIISFDLDYEQLQGILFSLLKDNKPIIKKVFDEINKKFIFIKV
jgi:type I restriction enzyme S subunit